MVRAWLIALIASLGALPEARAAQETFGGVLYDAPDAASGWEKTSAAGHVAFQKTITSDRGRKSSALIQIATPVEAELSGFDQNFEKAAVAVKELAEKKPGLKASGKTASGRTIRTEWRCCASVQGVSINQRTVGVASDDKQIFAVMVTFNLRGDAGKAADAEFERLARSFRFDAADGAELAPGKGDGGLEGAFTHLDTGIRPNAFGGTDYYAENRILFFDKSGLYARRLPPDGDIKRLCRERPTACGLYALKGGGFFSSAAEIEMRDVENGFGVIETRTRAFERNGDGVRIAKTRYNRLEPVSDGTPLEGSWRYFFASSGGMALSSGSVSSERTLTLDRSGRFTRSGFTAASSTSSAGGGTLGVTVGSKRPGESGTYRVDGFTLTLTDEAGKVETFSIFAPDGGDGILVIGGANYLKKR